ncbi:hypothetical protein GF373_16715 [bacterium]|nr:hypothetical protein [bacterium]
MAEFITEFSNLMYLFFPLFLLFLLFLVGYWFACSDFKPRTINLNDDFKLHSSPETSSDFSEPKKRELTEAELGIDDIDNAGHLPAYIQRQHQMEKQVKEYSTASPDETAGIIKGWLNSQ